MLLGPPIALAMTLSVAVWASVSCDDSESRAVPAQYPLTRMSLTEDSGKPDEIFATLAPGVRISAVVNLKLFEGFDPQMTLEAAQRRLGPPTGEWDDPYCRRTTPFYETSEGRVSLCEYPTEGRTRWDTVGYPRQRRHDHIFRDDRLPAQLAPWLLEDRAIDVHLVQHVGSGGVTVNMTKKGCAWVVLSGREQ